jgi:pyridoxal phosphate-dependent aminotransferase EpsN
MSNLLAAVGRGQMFHLKERVAARRAVFNRYVKAFEDLPQIRFMPEPSWSRSNRWLSAFTLDPAGKVGALDVVNALARQDIEARPVWKPMHLQPVFKGATYYSYDERRDVSAELFRHGVCLPSGSNMSEGQQSRVIKIVRDLF